MGIVDPYTLPPDLPEPEDDGGADHLPGLAIPQLVLPSSQGPVDLAELAAERAVLYVYPAVRGAGSAAAARLGRVSRRARLHAAVVRLSRPRRGARVRSAREWPVSRRSRSRRRSSSPSETTCRSRSSRTSTSSSARRSVSRRSRSPASTLYSRLALIAEHGTIVKVFYPVFPPDRNAGDVLAWLRENRAS